MLLTSVGFMMPIYAEDDFSITLDKSIYFLRDTLIINGNLDKIDPDEDKIKFEIVNPFGTVIDRFEVEREETGRDFTHSLSLIENIWNEDGLYRLRASYSDFTDTAYFHVFQSNTGLERHIDSTIGFDKTQYSWTDEVELYVVAPNFNRDNERIERVGVGTELTGTVTIKTSKGTLDKYELTETDTDSGIFFGKIVLTGDSQYDGNGDGINNDASGFTGGKGSKEGQIASRGSDELKAIFENEDEEVETSSKISWVLGEFQKMPEQIDEIDSVRIRVHDVDLNFKDDFEDYAYVLVWTDNVPESKKIQLRETHKRSGVFEGFVTLSTERSGLTTIKTQIPDTLHLKYVDATIPYDVYKTKTQDVIFDIRIGEKITGKIIPETTLEIPTWIRNNAKWYADGTIGESDFTQGIGYMIKNNVIRIPELPERDEGSVIGTVPDWVKNNARWWADGQISDGDFVSGIQHLVKKGIIRVN